MPLWQQSATTVSLTPGRSGLKMARKSSSVITFLWAQLDTKGKQHSGCGCRLRSAADSGPCWTACVQRHETVTGANNVAHKREQAAAHMSAGQMASS